MLAVTGAAEVGYIYIYIYVYVFVCISGGCVPLLLLI